MNNQIRELILSIDNLFDKLEDDNDNEKWIIFIGCLIKVISSKKIFKKNAHVCEFLNDNFNIVFAKYATKSRTIMLGKTVIYFNKNKDKYDINQNLNTIYSFVKKLSSNKDNVLSYTEVIKKIKL